ncbi:FMN-binding negative transcriptional regulator [Mucilaginibacter flavidus]|uniref:FMN-binding negative transcriptional regulator n=1 Tax=Mucilaginibacter flavidus TaxID=2949309 RepID=UPI002092B554|nr:FMN-binding negative transcriptional regulator [Mucilaginibacter flavidus]MCO5947620.1 FMN-binding negative transcriptional regulator [Mucilaginibacter flavidus]
MFIPSINKFEDIEEIVAFMQRYSFATIITAKDGVPVATHLPFIITRVNDKVILKSHLAKANPQSADIIDNKSLVIFTEPHAYISPKNYEKEQNVPTWNYLAVHAYGNCVILDNEDEKAALLAETIKYYEADYLKQYESLSDDYKSKMMKGIVAFQIIVDDLQAKKKLSQNRSEKERENIVESMGKSEDKNEQDIADYMKQLPK